MRPHTRRGPGAGGYVPAAGAGAGGYVKTTAPPGVGGAVVHQDLACGRIRPGGR